MRLWCRAGTEQVSARSRSPRTPRCGGTAACPSYRSALVLIRDPEAPLPAPGPALHRTDARARADRRMVRAALERRGHVPGSARPSRRRDESGSGPTRRLPAPRPAYSPCSRSSRCWLHGSRSANGDASRPPRGTPNRARPSPMRSPPCAVRSGARGLWRHHRADAPEQNTPSDCLRPGSMRSATLHEWPKSRLDV